MKLAALYDIHGNLPALEAVVTEAMHAGVDRILIGGDVVPGPMPTECLSLLKRTVLATEYIRGNGERIVLAARDGQDIKEVPEAFRERVRWTASQIDDETADWLRQWPLTTRIALPGFGDVVFCHATPRNDVDIFTKLTPAERLIPLFEPLNAKLVVCGHTHMQFDRMVGATRVVNAGSVGMPFQQAGAYWLLIDDDVRLRRTEYDLHAAARVIRATAFPQADQFAEGNVLRTPDEAKTLEAFEKISV